MPQRPPESSVYQKAAASSRKQRLSESSSVLQKAHPSESTSIRKHIHQKAHPSESIAASIRKQRPSESSVHQKAASIRKQQRPPESSVYQKAHPSESSVQKEHPSESIAAASPSPAVSQRVEAYLTTAYTYIQLLLLLSHPLFVSGSRYSSY